MIEQNNVSRLQRAQGAQGEQFRIAGPGADQNDGARRRGRILAHERGEIGFARGVVWCRHGALGECLPERPKDFLRRLSPMGSISTVQEIVDAVIYLTEAPHVTGEVLHVDGGAHIGKW
jgi:hypothetical protein